MSDIQKRLGDAVKSSENAAKLAKQTEEQKNRDAEQVRKTFRKPVEKMLKEIARGLGFHGELTPAGIFSGKIYRLTYGFLQSFRQSDWVSITLHLDDGRLFGRHGTWLTVHLDGPSPLALKTNSDDPYGVPYTTLAELEEAIVSLIEYRLRK